ncbi:MAG: hypothetical protein ACRBBJ_10115 [Rhodomicrobiaceae bacterium]
MMNYWPSILLVITCIIILFVKGKKEGAFAAFLIYLTFHFSYTFSIVLLGASRGEYLQNRELHSHLHGIIGGAFLLFLLLYIILRNQNTLILKLKFEIWNKLTKIIAVLLLLLWLSFAIQQFNEQQINILAFKNIISISLVFIFSFIFAMLIENKKILYKNSIIIYGILIAIFSIAWALFEIQSNYAWARTSLENGREVIRANSIFYNPNVMGVWFAILGVWGLFLISKKRVILGGHMLLLLSATGLLLSGSRSSLILILIVILSNAAVLVLARQSIRTTLIASLSFVGQLGVLCALPFLKGGMIIGASFQNSLQELAFRFIELPYILFLYVSGANMDDKYAAIMSINGRLQSGSSDNAYYTMITDSGVIGLLMFCCMSAYIFSLIVKAMISKPGINEIYAFSIFLTIIASGFMLRSFQVFPVWGIITVVLSLILSQIAQNKNNQKSSMINTYS